MITIEKNKNEVLVPLTLDIKLEFSTSLLKKEVRSVGSSSSSGGNDIIIIYTKPTIVYILLSIGIL